MKKENKPVKFSVKLIFPVVEEFIVLKDRYVQIDCSQYLDILN